MYYVRLHDSHGRGIPFSMYLQAFSEEMQRRGELLKTYAIDYPPDSRLYWKRSDKEISIKNNTPYKVQLPDAYVISGT